MPLSAGLLLYRSPGPGLQVLLAHMGGPFWASRDRAWTVPKGLPEDGEELHSAALREFHEELGQPAPAAKVPDLDLGEIRQSGGKTVRAWARLGDLDVTTVRSNLVEVTWPPRSGRSILVPEVDRAAWLTPDEARPLVVAAQVELIDRLVAALRA